MACDILFSVAWQCHEKDCNADGGWHKSTYWIDGRRYTADDFSDGDHQTVAKRDLPSHRDVADSWRRYSEWVLKHGTDPLGEFIVERETKRVRKYSATFTDSIGGLLLVKVRTANWRRVAITKMPDELETYLNVEAKGSNFYQRDLANVDECDSISGCKVRRVHGRRDATFACEVEFKVPKNPKVLAAALRKAARKHLDQKRGG
jgi:hypothetical protein